MLEITIPKGTLWDERNEEFVHISERTIKLEHSLVSLSKWESKWCKPFLSNDLKTDDELVDYIRCMTITQNVPKETYYCLSENNYKDIQEYINSPMTATRITNLQSGKKNSGRDVTSELIYYWMSVLNIPMECQKWHLNRLITLIELANIESQPENKMNAQETKAYYKQLNSQRRAKLNTRG